VTLTGSAARRYAEAILDIATADRSVDAVRGSLDGLALGLVGRSMRLLRDPSVPKARRLALAKAIVEREPAAVGSLTALLVQRDRIAILPEVASAYGELVDRREGVAKARITTAIALGETQKRSLVDQLERASGKRLRASFATDPALIGGAAVQVGDRLVDASVRTQLARMRDQLASGS
jgi:F-type H+-transporting ATPase subunit delta